MHASNDTVMGDQVSRQVQTEMRKKPKNFRFRTFSRGTRDRSMGRARRRASSEADRTCASLTPVIPRSQEAAPDHAREEPSRAPDATWRGLQGEWAVPDLVLHQRGTRESSESSEPVTYGSAAENVGPSRRCVSSHTLRTALSATPFVFERRWGACVILVNLDRLYKII